MSKGYRFQRNILYAAQQMQSGTQLRWLNTVTCSQNRTGNDRKVYSRLVATYRKLTLFDSNRTVLTRRLMMLFSPDRTVTLRGLILRPVARQCLQFSLPRFSYVVKIVCNISRYTHPRLFVEVRGIDGHMCSCAILKV